MRIFLLIFLLTITSFISYSQGGEWTWIHGNQIANFNGNFGVQGVPSATNEPPALYESCEWVDFNGNFWLFGGTNIPNDFGDLWKYDPATNEWTWMKGAGVPGAAPIYGVQGVPSMLNRPPASWGGINSWVDQFGDFWLFGGGGSSTNGMACGDLWKYDLTTNEWTWMKGPGTYNSKGSYGSIGVANVKNNPPSRTETAASWTDNNGDLWLFGGNSPYSSIDSILNDMWRFNIASNTWTWMKGSKYSKQPGNYGIIGKEDSANTPGGRWVYCRWKDDLGHLWLYGGGNYNDLWKFNVNTNNWTWVNGDSTQFATDVYGIKCVPALSYNPHPGSRTENRAAWVDRNNLWMFGGGGHWNDLWVYNIKSNSWLLASQDSLNILGVTGTLGVSNASNIPNGSWGSIGWTDNLGHLFLFGGAIGTYFYNTLWKFTIDTNCVFPAKINEVSLGNDFSIYPNPSNGFITFRNNNFNSDDSFEVEAFDTFGNKIFSKIVVAEIETAEIKLPAGLYLFTISCQSKKISKKIIIE